MTLHSKVTTGVATSEPIGRLIVAGTSVSVPFPVITWQDQGGLSLRGIGCADTRTDPSGRHVDLLVLHWDGCPSSHECHRVLVERGLSAHLLVDGDGTVFQTLDLAVDRAWHARGFNDRSIGVEVQNPVHLNRGCAHNGLHRRAVTEPMAHDERAVWTHWDFTDTQKYRVKEVVSAVTGLFGIPKRLPLKGSEVATGVVTPAFKGVCGHYHLSPDKQDPGRSLWPSLRESLLT